MKLGITLFGTDTGIGPADLARAVEERGFHSLYLPEHTHMPVGSEPPGLVDGVSMEDYRRSLDPFVALAVAAGVTERILLGTGIALVAQHDPITLAKQIATLDVVSGGRFVLGVGFGWNRAEAVDHGVDFARRREIAADKMRCMRALWTRQAASGGDTRATTLSPGFQGEFAAVSASYAWPKPLRQPGPRTLVGGGAGPKLFAAVAEYADGWMPIGGAGIGAALPALRRAFEAAGRDPATAEVVPFGTIPDPGKLAHLASLGIAEVVLRVPNGPRDDVLRALDAHTALH